MDRRLRLPRPDKSTLAQGTIIMLWGMACLAFFQGCYRYHFFYQEQNQIFLLTADYAASYLQRPAWLACLAGDFLTQFYYYLWAGPVILTLALLAMGDIARRALQTAGLPRWWAFAIAMLLMTAEAVCCLKVSHRLSSVIALGGGMATYLALTPMFRRSAWQAAASVAGAAMAYWLFGYGMWAYLLLLLADTVAGYVRRTHRRGTAWRILALAVVPIVVVAAPHYYLTTEKALAYPGIGMLTTPDMALEKCLAVDNEYHFGHYDRVTRLVESEQHPTDPMLFFYNLVQAKAGQLPEHLLQYRPNQLGTFYAIGPDTPLITIKNMNELYWALGDMTLTERAAMMTNVFAPDNRNVRMIKRLAECNLVSGDTLAARKYLRLLSKTWAYSDWARRIMDNDEKTFQPLKEKKAYTNRCDTIRLDDNLHRVMMELLDSNPDNFVALDYILCSNLLLKDIENFKRDYDRYCIDTEKPRVKPLYQQALMIYLAGTQASQEEWQKYIHDPAMVAQFEQYSNQRGNPQFSNTYWYYFDTAKVTQP